MPHALLTLPDVYESVTRRVAIDVTAQLAKLMRLPGDTLVYLPGNAGTVPMNGGTFGECCVPDLKYPADARLVVRYEEEVDDNTTLTSQVNTKENPPLFNDPIRGVVMRPVFRYVTLTVTLEYTAPSIVIAQRWLDEMRSRVSMGRAELYQDLQYHYAIPKPAIAVLKAVHDTMEASAFPTGLTFEQWVTQYLTHPVTVVSTLTGTDRTLAVPEHQYEVLGWFDFTASPPTPSKDSEGNGTYVSTINYQLRYNRPMQVYVRYPFVVHQRPIPKAFRPQQPYESYRVFNRKVSVTRGSLGVGLDLMLAKRLPYIHYPDTDDWTTRQVPRDRLTFFTGLVVLAPDDLRTLLDLNDLGSMRFHPYFLEYFYHQQDRLLTPMKSIFEFRLYENDELVADVGLEMVPGTVTFRAKKDLDPTKTYRVQISYVRDWFLLDRDVIACLRRYPHVAYLSLRALGVKLAGAEELSDLSLFAAGSPRTPSDDCPGEGVHLGQFPWLPAQDDVITTGLIKLRDMEEALKHLDDNRMKPVDWDRVGPVTVMYFDILTEKR